MVSPEDQEKTTFACPYGTFAFKRISFGLCNALTTFQRRMTAIFSDLIENIMEVFMDDFSMYGCSFDNCMTNLQVVLQRCRENFGFELGKVPFHGARRHRAWTPHLLQMVGSG